VALYFPHQMGDARGTGSARGSLVCPACGGRVRCPRSTSACPARWCRPRPPWLDAVHPAARPRVSRCRAAGLPGYGAAAGFSLLLPGWLPSAGSWPGAQPGSSSRFGSRPAARACGPRCGGGTVPLVELSRPRTGHDRLRPELRVRCRRSGPCGRCPWPARPAPLGHPSSLLDGRRDISWSAACLGWSWWWSTAPPRSGRVASRARPPVRRPAARPSRRRCAGSVRLLLDLGSRVRPARPARAARDPGSGCSCGLTAARRSRARRPVARGTAALGPLGPWSARLGAARRRGAGKVRIATLRNTAIGWHRAKGDTNIARALRRASRRSHDLITAVISS
jgi:hypothetical protein